MAITKATQGVLEPNICTTDTIQVITGDKTINANIGIGVSPDPVIGLSLDSSGIKFNDSSILDSSNKIVTTNTRQTITGEKVIQALYNTTSTTSLTIGLGAKTLTVQTGLSWDAGRDVFITNGSTRSMSGSVTSYNPTTGVMVANITTLGGGTGTYASWTVTQQTGTALPALRITSNDSANAFIVEDSTNPDSSPFLITGDGRVCIGTTANGYTDQYKLYVNGNGNIDSINTNTIAPRQFGSSLYLYTGEKYAFGGGIVSYGGGWGGKGDNRIINTQWNGPQSLSKFTNAIISGNIGNNASTVYSLVDPGLLYLPFYDMLQSTQVLPVGYGGTLQIKIMSHVIATTVATGVQVQTVGAYTSPVYVVNAVTNSSNFTGFTLNGVTTATNITTVDGLAQTAGGVPASGYATIQAVAATTTAHGGINLTLRGHTTADSGTTTFSSFTTAEIISCIIRGDNV